MPKLEPVTSEFLDSAPFRVVVDVQVPAPIEACWSLLVDQASWVQWFDDMKSVHATPWLWTEPGQTRTVAVGPMSVDEVAISVEHEREYAFSIVKWPLRNTKRAAEGVRLVDQSTNGTPLTLLTYIGAFESTSLGRRLEPVLEKKLGQAWGTALANLGALASQRTAANV